MEDHLEEVFAMRYSPGGTGGEVVEEREKGKETGGGHYDLDLDNVAIDAKCIVDHLEEAVATRYVVYGEDGVEEDKKKKKSKGKDSSASTTPAVSQSTPKSESASSKSSSQSSSTSKTCGGIHDACCFGKGTNNKRCQPGLGCHYGLDHNGDPTDPPLEHPTCQLDCGKDKAPCCQSLCSHDDCKCECGNGTVHNIVTKLCEKCGMKDQLRILPYRPYGRAPFHPSGMAALLPQGTELRYKKQAMWHADPPKKAPPIVGYDDIDMVRKHSWRQRAEILEYYGVKPAWGKEDKQIELLAKHLASVGKGKKKKGKKRRLS